MWSSIKDMTYYICTKHRIKQYYYIMNLATALAQSYQSVCCLYEESFPRRFFFCGYLMFLFCLVFAMSLCASVYVCFMSPAGKGLTSWLSFVVSNCEFVTFPLVSWVRCGTWLYRFLIFAPLLTLIHSFLLSTQQRLWSEWAHTHCIALVIS